MQNPSCSLVVTSAVADWKGLLRQWCDRRAALCAERGLETPDDELEAQPDRV
mgnify:CR=1 FL=1